MDVDGSTGWTGSRLGSHAGTTRRCRRTATECFEHGPATAAAAWPKTCRHRSNLWLRWTLSEHWTETCSIFPYISAMTYIKGCSVDGGRLTCQDSRCDSRCSRCRGLRPTILSVWFRFRRPWIQSGPVIWNEPGTGWRRIWQGRIKGWPKGFPFVFKGHQLSPNSTWWCTFLIIFAGQV